MATVAKKKLGTIVIVMMNLLNLLKVHDFACTFIMV